ncbi:MAG: Phosphoenolpyruvate-dihydroxyacetone phosphotransferase [Candidatus Carbobacillus altaicus]|uniref:phosphoenolpyruvate--glycerone phosphotransferase n=1 Tax=Candidatus Carbonibacillus altaicus TaxID=2163959 RepID=A0A2R6Y3S1_9BACL|nr:MAG: Phosphoenolpyruvate-dihydroxyacetone phosphotransferase [Candidatus Carbobacillus altaicus]
MLEQGMDTPFLRPVGLVLVSHSQAIARGTRELAEQMAGGMVPIRDAGGTLEGAIGTDTMRVIAVIQDVLKLAEVAIVLMDLGSAYLSTETALEMLDKSFRSRVRLSTAPFVEGAIIAAVTASTGASVEEVLKEADAARFLPKQ